MNVPVTADVPAGGRNGRGGSRWVHPPVARIAKPPDQAPGTVPVLCDRRSNGSSHAGQTAAAGTMAVWPHRLHSSVSHALPPLPARIAATISYLRSSHTGTQCRSSFSEAAVSGDAASSGGNPDRSNAATKGNGLGKIRGSVGWSRKRRATRLLQHFERRRTSSHENQERPQPRLRNSEFTEIDHRRKNPIVRLQSVTQNPSRRHGRSALGIHTLRRRNAGTFSTTTNVGFSSLGRTRDRQNQKIALIPRTGVRSSSFPRPPLAELMPGTAGSPTAVRALSTRETRETRPRHSAMSA